MSHVKRLALLVGMVLVACVLPACGAQGQSPTAQANANEALFFIISTAPAAVPTATVCELPRKRITAISYF